MSVIRLADYHAHYRDTSHRVRYQFKPWKLVLVAGGLLSIGIWYGAWLVLKLL